MTWTELDIGYIAGLLEGEGCFSIRPEGGPRIVIGMTDQDTIRNIPVRLGIGTVSGPYDKGLNRKLVWEWHVGGVQDVSRLLLAIYPLMSERRKNKISELADVLKMFSETLFCLECNKAIRFQNRSRKDKIYCSHKCNSKHYQRVRRGNIVRFLNCQVCDSSFLMEDGRQKFCNKLCYRVSKNQRRRKLI